jgi:hypothetical protein
MISKTLRTTDGQIVIAIPSMLSELTLGMLIAMQNDNSELETISILSGIDKEELCNVRNINDFELFRDHVLSLAHQISYESDNLTIPKSIIIMGKKVDVINNLSIEPAGAFMECRNIIADEINEHRLAYGDKEWDEYFEANGKMPIDFKPSLNSAALILAHYLYCPATNLPYNEEKAEAFKSEALKLSMALTMPIAKYFFLSYPNLWKQKQSYLKVVIQLWKKRRELKRSKGSRTIIL